VFSPSSHLLHANRARKQSQTLTAMHSTAHVRQAKDFCTHSCRLVNNSGLSHAGHHDLPTHEEGQPSCNNLTVSSDTTPGAAVTPFVAPPTWVSRTAHHVSLEAPPTSVPQPPVTWSRGEEMAGQDDIRCYCSTCEPGQRELVSGHDSLGFSPPALHTGWPLTDFPDTTDLFTRCLRIYDLVRASGAPNFLSARVPLPHQLNIARWREYLHGHTDVALVDFLEYGFPIGFNPSHPLESTDRNHASALLHPLHVQTYLDKEIDSQAMLGPFDAPPFWPWCHLNPIMTRPKKDSQDRRVILDMSWPLHASVNGGTH
jgi:hypothetical protein